MAMTVDDYGSFLGYPSLINRQESYSRFLNTTSTTWASAPPLYDRVAEQCTNVQERTINCPLLSGNWSPMFVKSQRWT